MAAGLGFKTFQTGEVLTASDVNGYLMQGILVFASEAARNSAITSPQEGQFAFTKDNNSLWYYTGSAWVASGATGDIEGVTAGVGISGGGTSGTVTITNDMATTITASGDIVVGTGSGTYDNLPIGTTGQILTADTTVSPYKVKWATPASGADFKGFSAYLNTAQTPTASTYTKLAFSAENFDTEGWFDTSLYRFTPTTAGYYKIDVMVMPNSTNRTVVYLYKNGAVLTRTIDQQVAASLSGTYSAPFYSNGTDYWEVYIFQSATSGPMQLGTDLSVFSATYLGV
jgi:hypothetical protein